MIIEKFASEDTFDVKPECHIFPSVSERGFWEESLKNQIDFFEKNKAEYDKEPKKFLTASLYREYQLNGNRSNYEDVYFLRRAELVTNVILECYYNDGRFMNDILDLTWIILEETTWTLPAHNREVDCADTLPDYNRHSLDLFLAETACVMCFVYQTVGDKLDEMSKVVTRRIKERIRHDVIDDYLARTDYWWMGFSEAIPNNWNPWINSNVLVSAMTVVDDEKLLKKVVFKVMRTLDKYLLHYPQDGACDEGPSYWNQAGLCMLECMWLLKTVTDGKADFFGEEKVINTSEYLMKVYTGKGECVNFADSGVKLPIYYGSIYKLGKIMNNQKLISFAKHLYDTRGEYEIVKKKEITAKTIRVMDMIRYSAEMEKIGDMEFKTDSDYYFESTGVVTARAECDPQKGLFLAAKGGHNGESHNHNDVGNFVVYKNGTKFIVDSGNMTYSRITFSPERYTLWTTRSGYHNLPIIDGMEQKAGREYSAKNTKFESDGKKLLFSLDIKDAYPNREKIGKWERTLCYDKAAQEISVTEDFAFADKYGYELCFLTPQKTTLQADGILFEAENGETLKMLADMTKFEFEKEEIKVEDALLLKNWGSVLYRIRLKARSKEDKLTYVLK